MHTVYGQTHSCEDVFVVVLSIIINVPLRKVTWLPKSWLFNKNHYEDIINLYLVLDIHQPI